MALSVRVTGLDAALAAVMRWNPAAYVAAAAPVAGQTILDSLRLYINVRTGKTRDSLAMAIAGPHVLFGGNAVAGYLAYGTAPHTILPRSARVLAFQGSDGMAFARRVNHPGTRPYPYPQQAVEAALPAVAEQARAAAYAVMLGGA